ncbi:MAG: restriction endonuclease, partial [Holophagales bacterium]|nr:restriction endonuclease [Holophagales bacterium]
KRNRRTSFQKVGKGLFTLKNKADSIESPVLLLDEQNRRVRKDLRERLFTVDPFQFEFLIADLLQKIGFENIEVTARSGDKGIDIVANLTVGGVTNVKTVVQVKRYKSGNRISGSVVRELRGAAEVDQRGLVITTSEFQKTARVEAMAPNKMPVSLINGSELIDLMVRYEVGVKKETATILSIDGEYFENQVGPEDGRPIDTRKNRSLWPLPGGTRQYIDTLNEILQAVSDGVRDRNELVSWLIDKYQNVTSKKTAFSYTNVPKSMGLLLVRDGRVELSPDGIRYLRTKDVDLLHSIISENILAFDDIVEFVASSGEPQNEKKILEFVNDNFDVNWTTYAQVNFRVLWLLNLGKLSKTGQGYIAT